VSCGLFAGAESFLIRASCLVARIGLDWRSRRLSAFIWLFISYSSAEIGSPMKHVGNSIIISIFIMYVFVTAGDLSILPA